jgi:hypothetical protein
MSAQLDELNLKLQEKHNTATSLFKKILSFKDKLTLLLKAIETDTLLHFPSLKKYTKQNPECSTGFTFFPKRLAKCMLQLLIDFRKEKATLIFPLTPFEADVSALNFLVSASVDQAEFDEAYTVINFPTEVCLFVRQFTKCGAF